MADNRSAGFGLECNGALGPAAAQGFPPSNWHLRCCDLRCALDNALMRFFYFQKLPRPSHGRSRHIVHLMGSIVMQLDVR